MNNNSTENYSQFKKIFNELQQYKQANRILKQQVTHFIHQHNFNQQLLDEKSKHIISCTSENIALRKEIELLKKKLASLQMISKMAQTHTHTKPKSKKHNATTIQQLKLILQDKQMSLDNKQLSFDDSKTNNDEFQMLSSIATSSNEHKSTIENTSSSNTPLSNSPQLPYVIMPGMNFVNTDSSNLSVQACKLSLPTNSKSNASMITHPSDQPEKGLDLTNNISDISMSIPIPSNKPSISKIKVKSNILKPIEENNENSQFSNDQYTFSPITPITPNIQLSNNNKNIHENEWSQAYATIAQTPTKSAQQQEEEDEDETDDDANVVYLDYSAAVTDSSHTIPRTMQTHSNITDLNDLAVNHDISLMKPMTTLPITSANMDSDQTINSKYNFPLAISALSSLTISDTEDYVSN